MPDFESSLVIKPQVNLSRSTAVRMWLLVICCLLAVTQSALGDNGASVGVAFSALVSAILTELLITCKRHGLKKIKDGSAAASALILALMLPNHIHSVYAALGAAFAMVVVKHSFGGLGSNWLNPALAGWLFIRLSWPRAFTEPLAEATVFEGHLTESVASYGSAAGRQIGDLLNKYVFSFFGADLPPGYIDLFSLQSPGIIADRAMLALILATVAVTAFLISRVWLSLLYLAVFCLLVRIFGDPGVSGIPGAEGVLGNGNVILALFSGGTLPAAFFLIVEPSGGAKSVQGGALMALIAAFLGFAFRYFGGELYGCFYAAALVNAFTPMLCRAERLLFSDGITYTGRFASKGGKA